MIHSRHIGWVFLLGCVLLGTSGCGSDASLARVSGTVTLDGKPLAEATVEFHPAIEPIAYGLETGSYSFATTDAKGHYELMYTHEKSGAIIGEHVVKVSTRRMTLDAQGKEVVVAERVPAEFNRNSKLKKEVKPGSNDIPIAIVTSKEADASK